MNESTMIYLIIGAAVLVGALALALLRKRVRTVRRKRVVSEARDNEWAIRLQLGRLREQGFRVFHYVKSGKFNIDHVVVGQGGVFVLESRSLAGQANHGPVTGNHRVNYKEGVLSFPKGTASRPLERARSHAAWISGWLSRRAGVPVKAKPVVVLSGWKITTTGDPAVAAVAAEQIDSFLAGSKVQLFSDSELERIVSNLEDA